MNKLASYIAYVIGPLVSKWYMVISFVIGFYLTAYFLGGEYTTAKLSGLFVGYLIGMMIEWLAGGWPPSIPREWLK